MLPYSQASNNYYENAQIVMDLVRNASEILNSSKIERRRQIINIVFQNLELHGRELKWKYKKPFDSMASYTNDSSWLSLWVRYLNRYQNATKITFFYKLTSFSLY